MTPTRTVEARKLARLVLLPVGAAALAVIVLWVLPSVLTREPSDGLTAAERLKAANDVRPPLVAFLIALGTGGSLWFTSRTYLLSREGHVTDRYTKAVGQLGEESPAVKIGGVYALGRIGIDSPKDRSTIVSVLGAFIREQSHVMRERLDEPSEAVKAGLLVAGRLLPGCDATLDLRGADLSHSDLRALPRDRVQLEGANTSGAQSPSSA